MTTHALDEETRKKLLGLLPVSQGATIKFTPKCFEELPVSIRPVFIQRSMTKVERSALLEFEESNLQKQMEYMEEIDGKMVVKTSDKAKYAEFIKSSNQKAAAICEAARKSIVGWENVFCPSTGQLIPFVPDEAKSIDLELYSGICDDAKVELYNNMKLISSLLPQEKLALK